MKKLVSGFFSVPDLVKISETNFQLKISAIIFSSCFSNNFSSLLIIIFWHFFFFFREIVIVYYANLQIRYFSSGMKTKSNFWKLSPNRINTYTGWRNPKMVWCKNGWVEVRGGSSSEWWWLWCITRNLGFRVWRKVR